MYTKTNQHLEQGGGSSRLKLPQVLGIYATFTYKRHPPCPCHLPCQVQSQSRSKLRIQIALKVLSRIVRTTPFYGKLGSLVIRKVSRWKSTKTHGIQIHFQKKTQEFILRILLHHNARSACRSHLKNTKRLQQPLQCCHLLKISCQL
jgi:hypothetical protein